MTDFEMIVKEFCIPIESDWVCDELCGWDVDEEDESWCSRNCGKTNCGKYPEMNCYKEWIKMKKGSESIAFNTDKDNYCPNCGAKMQAESEDKK